MKTFKDLFDYIQTLALKEEMDVHRYAENINMGLSVHNGHHTVDIIDFRKDRRVLNIVFSYTSDDVMINKVNNLDQITYGRHLCILNINDLIYYGLDRLSIDKRTMSDIMDFMDVLENYNPIKEERRKDDMKHYDVIFCNCGRIHFMAYHDTWDWMAKVKPGMRYIYHVCQNCGSSYKYFLTSCDDGYAQNGTEVTNVTIDTDSQTSKIILSTGVRVPMKCGDFADYYHGNQFCASEYMKKKFNTTSITSCAEKEPGIIQVDIPRLVRMLNDSEKAIALHGFLADEDWSAFNLEYMKKEFKKEKDKK